MSDDGARYLERVIRERDDWRRIANERAAHLVSLNWRLRKIVLTLALRKRAARRAMLEAERRFRTPHKLDGMRLYDARLLEACEAYELARSILRGQQT